MAASKPVAKGKPTRSKVSTAVAKATYSADEFDILEGLEGVKMNPTMYLGDLGAMMVFRTIKEWWDNAYDEFIAGRNTVIEVILDYDKDHYVVADCAGGIPVDMKTLKTGEKISVMTAAYTRTHAGGKFRNNAYKTSAGTHGVGVAAVNAVSKWMKVWTNRSGQLYHQEYAGGEIVGPKDPVKVKSLDKELCKHLTLDHKKYGTVGVYQLDQSIVSVDATRSAKKPKTYTHAAADEQAIRTCLHNVAFLNPGLKVILTVVRNKKAKTETHFNDKDLKYTVTQYVQEQELTPQAKPLVFRNDNIILAVQWTEKENADLFNSFVNTSPTADGGTHVAGLVAALATALKPYAPVQKSKAKGKSQGYKEIDLLIGCAGFFDWRMHGAQYHSQVKDKLVSNVKPEVEGALTAVFTKYFDENKKLASNIVKRAIAASSGREELGKIMRGLAETKAKSKGGLILPELLTMATRAKPDQRELYIVEGDSAGGTADNARIPDYQEILKCGGKPLNAVGSSLAKVLGHDVVQAFLIALGVDLKSLDPQADKPELSTKGLRCKAVFFLADADPDGKHINALLLAVAYRLMPDLFKEGRILIVDSPLYSAIYKGKVYGGSTYQECRDNAPPQVSLIIRAKGWGEVEPDVMHEIAFNPKNRKLYRINPFASSESEKLFRQIVSESPEARRVLLGLE